MLALSDDFDLYSQVLLSKSFFVSKSVSLCYLCQLSTYWIFFFFNDTATTEIYTLHIVGSVRCVQETAIRIQEQLMWPKKIYILNLQPFSFTKLSQFNWQLYTSYLNLLHQFICEAKEQRSQYTHLVERTIFIYIWNCQSDLLQLFWNNSVIDLLYKRNLSNIKQQSSLIF
eukprot:TRINITY_DN7168_c0_g1_i2.p1 TRINITY_DN7168_c0_g1~~TRINITY_DN7168_c0_g1_i2.p1  ORF type:complete len:171 (-),score=17.88 TRINITY_DN7168_c0_g1_i2:781-1293(-)